MTSNIFWLVFVVALGLPSAVMGILVRRLEKKMDKQEAKREEQENARVEMQKTLINLSIDSLELAKVTAEAVQRIPDANCNGEMKGALDRATNTLDTFRNIEREQAAKIIVKTA